MLLPCLRYIFPIGNLSALSRTRTLLAWIPKLFETAGLPIRPCSPSVDAALAPESARFVRCSLNATARIDRLHLCARMLAGCRVAAVKEQSGLKRTRFVLARGRKLGEAPTNQIPKCFRSLALASPTNAQTFSDWGVNVKRQFAPVRNCCFCKPGSPASRAVSSQAQQPFGHPRNQLP